MFLPGTAQKFSDFLLEVRVSFNLKVTEPDFFFEKNLVLKFLANRAQVVPKMRFFKFYEKLIFGFSLIFDMELQQHKVLKFTKKVTSATKLFFAIT